MAGTAEKIDMTTKEDEQVGLLRKAYEILKQIFTKESKEMTKDEIVTIVKETVPKPMDTESMTTIFKAAFGEAIKPLTDRIEKLEKQTPGSGQDVKSIEKTDDLEAIGREIAKRAMGGK
jgi:hypothetical protein